MMKPAFEHTAAAEQNAIATARRHLQADRNQQLIAKVFSKADEAEEGLTPRAYRERNAAVRLEARVKLAEEGERTALELRPVDDAAVVWVRALPADAAAAGLRGLLDDVVRRRSSRASLPTRATSIASPPAEVQA
eukprot:COSAG04_NODE_1289_length_7362_cov_3.297122_1_plen_135_part_00